MPLSGGFRRTTQRNGREVNEFLARASLLLPRFSLTGFVRLSRHRGLRPIAEDGTRVGLLANTRFLGL